MVCDENGLGKFGKGKNFTIIISKTWGFSSKIVKNRELFYFVWWKKYIRESLKRQLCLVIMSIQII